MTRARRNAAPRGALTLLALGAVGAWGLLAPAAAARAAPPPADPPELWPPEQREFYLDGPAWLMSEAQREALAAMGEAERGAAVEAFLAQPEHPGISAAELGEAIRLRRALMRSEFLSPADVRARLLFLRGAPAERLIVDCGDAFQPLEVWSYPAPGAEEDPEARDELLVYRPGPGRPWKIWLPFDSKRALYMPQMEYFLEQWEENDGRAWTAERFDLQTCPETRRVDRVTGVQALTRYLPNRPRAEDFLRFVEPPEDLARWVKEAAATPLAASPPALGTSVPEVLFPRKTGQRLVARFQVAVPDAWELPTAPAEGGDPEAEKREIRLVVEGVIEAGRSVFEEFRVRFALPPPPRDTPVVLVFEEPLRPEQDYLVRFRVRDEISGRSAYLAQGFRAPAQPSAVALPEPPQDAVIALGNAIARQPVAGQDSLLLVPPAADIVLSYWRAEAIVTGERIARVTFSVDGELQLTANRRPYSVELRLARYPKEQVVRAEGWDQAGERVAADEVVINQPRGAFAVRIVEPPPGRAVEGDEIEVVAQVVVPDGRRVEDVVFQVDGEEVARVERPPWQARVRPPIVTGLSYLSVTARLDDGRSAEDVRILNAPDFVEQLDVDLVELYAAVTDRSGRPVKGLTAEDFEVFVDGQRVEINRFETVDNLPLTVGLTLDASGSMASNLVVAQQAAREFLAAVIGVRDHSFAVGFSDVPILLMPPTQDAEAVADALGRLRAVGWTALHDAVVTSLYYFRGFPGQRALVLLSDGDDTRSSYTFDEVLEYARRSGTAVYSVGVGVGFGGAKRKLDALASETGGRAFFIARAEELSGVYGEIEEELRSRYMLAIAPVRKAGQGYQAVEVRVKTRGLQVRTARGVYP
jgi:Ca-activated chloride channel homolog